METKVDNRKYHLKVQKKASEVIQSSFNTDFLTTSIKAQNQDHFIEFRKLSNEERLEVIKAGFKANQEGKLSFKEYFEGKGKDTLFEWKVYRIKYESVRKTKCYKNLKVSD